MPELPITPAEEAELVRQLTELLHVHLPDAKGRGSVLIAVGVAMLGEAQGEFGLQDAAIAACQAIAATADALPSIDKPGFDYASGLMHVAPMELARRLGLYEVRQ